MSADQKHTRYQKRDRVQTPGRSPAIRLDSAQIDREPNDAGLYEVLISGHGLYMMIAPPAIDIGGVPLVNVSFADDGRSITGAVTESPSERQVVVDYGFARDTTELEQKSP